MLEELREKRTALTVKEVAILLKISEREIYKLASSNQIPHFRVGCSVRFEPRSVATWLEDRLLTSAIRRPPTSVSSPAGVSSKTA
jgi:excisionase family DNA binding protein